MGFTMEDFHKPEIAQRISVITMMQMGKNPLTPFKNLDPSVQKKFNRLMNNYIKTLPDDFMPKLLEDFNQIVNEEIFNESFNPALFNVPRGDKKLLLTDEQKDLIEKGVITLTKEEKELANNEIKD